MIHPKHKHKTNPKNNSNIKTQINNQMNRMNNDSQFKSIHKSIDTTSTPDEIKLYKRVSHINDESFKDRYCNLLKDLQTRITWEKEKLTEQFKTKFQNKIRINNDTVYNNQSKKTERIHKNICENNESDDEDQPIDKKVPTDMIDNAR